MLVSFSALGRARLRLLAIPCDLRSITSGVDCQCRAWAQTFISWVPSSCPCLFSSFFFLLTSPSFQIFKGLGAFSSFGIVCGRFVASGVGTRNMVGTGFMGTGVVWDSGIFFNIFSNRRLVSSPGLNQFPLQVQIRI
ncbi:hypothetical protein LY76DRAFT_195056 [Colletotrichum caudatum]|nr:hypothetical protein LY76DRAFT_195056 [Colletotrichum caudatum]